MKISREDARKLGVPPPARRHKYGARKTTVDGIVFASAREARRYGELRLLEKAGKITGLELQPKFGLQTHGAAGGMELVGSYVADFAYTENGRYVVEDVKGFKTPLYRWKKKHFELEWGIPVTET